MKPSSDTAHHLNPDGLKAVRIEVSPNGTTFLSRFERIIEPKQDLQNLSGD